MTRILPESLKGTGRRRIEDRLGEAQGAIRKLRADNTFLQRDAEQLASDLAQALLRGCVDATALAEALEENTRLKARVQQLTDKVIRAEVDKQRLRQAVINARPRIDVAVQRLDRPYVSHVQIPYPVPVGRDTSSDDTVTTPLVDLPQTAA